jgi:hypothetical protein
MMLREIFSTASAERRRWFSSATMDLIVWLDEDCEAVAFQLCYDKSHHEKALVWRVDSPQLTCQRVDDGEQAGIGHKASPLLLPGEPGAVAPILTQFMAQSAALPASFVTCVVAALEPHITNRDELHP